MAEYKLKNGMVLTDEEQIRLMKTLKSFDVHKSFTYSYDDIGTATLFADLYEDSLRYCPQNNMWYLWNNNRWEKQSEDGYINDTLQTLLNMLMLYCKEFDKDDEDDGEDELKAYRKYVKSIRTYTKMRNILEVAKTMSNIRLSLKDMDTDPYILNTPTKTIDLRTGKAISNPKDYNITKCTSVSLPNKLTKKCDRWYEFIDEIMSHDKAKAKFLQKALGYSILGVNREECMFYAYGSTTRNGKGTLFSTINGVLGGEYSDSAPTDLICESKNGKAIDFNAPQPTLAKLVGTRLVSMAETNKDVRLDSASIKTMTGRDALTTRGLFQNSFTFVPQFTLWLNTNHLPAVTDDTIFTSDRVYVIEFNEHFDKETQDKDLKELFSDPQNKPTILQWLYDGCRMYMTEGLNPPECVVKATADYRRMHDRIGCFIEDCYTIDSTSKILRGDVYTKYCNWCNKSENKYKPLGSTSFYNEMSTRGYSASKSADGFYIKGLKNNE